jgi:cystathionine beta-lyase
MIQNFDEIIVRDNTDCLKYDAKIERFGTLDIKPMWVADMDFRIPDFISETFHEIVNHSIYGYHFKTDKYYQAIIDWFLKRHEYVIKKEDIFFAPGVVPVLSYLIQALTEIGDEIIVQTPVYYPFFSVIEQNKRKLVVNQLLEKDNKYTIDFDDFERKAKTAKMFILCSPHNPVGRVWTKEELMRIANICLRNKVIVISDEIHNDLVFAPHKHIPFASLSSEIEDITITCHAASKTFNLAGLSTAYIFIKNDQLKRKYKLHQSNLHVDSLNVFGLKGMVEAYNKGESWLAELKEYIRNNYIFLCNQLAANLPKIKVSPLEATYLVWLDFREYNFSDNELKQIIIEKAKLGLNDGPIFGVGGSGFQRINIACPRIVVQNAVEQLGRVFK